MATEILFSPIGSVTTPFVKELHSYTPDTITFDGYFYMEDGAMPGMGVRFLDLPPADVKLVDQVIQSLETLFYEA